jgi:glycosyltransferase involved in cell wall biosynthesis
MEAEDYAQPMLSIVIPAFNEASRIGDSIKKVDAFMRQSPLSFELIVVDDGSNDNTAEVVSQAQVKGLRLVRNEKNHGKGYTVRQGVLDASGKYVLFTDADLSAPIEEVNKLLDVASKEGADVVIGSRAIDRKYIEKHQSPLRETGGIVFNLMVRMLLGLRLHDTQCGFKLFHRQRSRRIF